MARKKRKTKVPRSISSECPYCLGGRKHSRAAHERALARIAAKRGNPATIRGWVKAKSVKIVRNAKGQATRLLIKT